MPDTPATKEVTKEDDVCFHTVFKDPSLRLHTREERTRLKSVVDEAVKKELKFGDTWYFLNERWFVEMSEYLEDLDGSKARQPGPIDNDFLFVDINPWETELCKKTGRFSLLRRDIDSKHKLIAEEGWNELVQAFGFR